jgi:hypothetical protein
MRGNAFLQQGMRTYFAHHGILRTYLFIPCGLAVVLIIVWPRGSLESMLRSGPVTDAFSVIALAFLALLLYLGARYGSEDFSPDTLVQLREYVTMTPVSLFSVVLGKGGFFVLHTLFLLLLGAPFLLAPLAVGGLTLPKAFEAFAILGTAGLAARMFGLLVLALVGTRLLVRDMILLPAILLIVVATLVAVPSLSPIHALLGLADAQTPGAPAAASMLSSAAACSLVNGGAALVCAAAVLLVLRSSRRRARIGRRAGG